MEQQHSYKPEMQLRTESDDPPANLLITVDRAPAQERPFADIPNPYDSACSVLCNHPYGHRLNWFTRRFVWFSRMVSRKSSILSEKSVVQPSVKNRNAEWSSPESQRLVRCGMKPSQQCSTGHGHNVAFHLAARKHGTLAKSEPFGDQSFSPSKSTGTHQNKAGDNYDGVYQGPDTKAWLQSSAEADDSPFSSNQAISTQAMIEKADHKEQQQSSPKRHKKKKKASKKKRGKKKDSSLNADSLRNTDDLQWMDSTMLMVKKSRKGKRAAGRRVVPASREELENPLTLVEGDEHGNGLQRRRDQNVEIVTGERFSTPTDSVAWNEVVRDTLQKQLDEELEGSQYDPKRLQDLQSALQASMAERSRAQVNKELQEINEEISKKTSRSDHWMHHPRIPNMRCCRFELPMDAQLLTLLNPVKYLSTYCMVPRKRRQLFFKVFTKYRGTENHLTFQTLPKALKDVFGEPIEAAVLETIYTFSQVGPDSLIELPVFIGLAALTERFLCQKIPLENAVTKDRVEEMDFSDLDFYLRDIQITEPIEQLLYWIKDS